MSKNDFRKISWKVRIILDFVSFLYTYCPAILSFMLTLYICEQCIEKINIYILFFLFPVVLCFIFFIITYLFYKSLPKLKTGQFELKMSIEVVAWYLHIALNRSSKILGLRYLINSFFILRFLHLRSLGANVRFDLGTSLDFVIADLPLITIGSNCTIGQNTYISCHLISNNKLFLSPVKIGNNVKLAMNCVVGPGSRIEDNCNIEFGNNIYGVRINEGTRLRPLEWVAGPPSTKANRDK